MKENEPNSRVRLKKNGVFDDVFNGSEDEPTVNFDSKRSWKDGRRVDYRNKSNQSIKQAIIEEAISKDLLATDKDGNYKYCSDGTIDLRTIKTKRSSGIRRNGKSGQQPLDIRHFKAISLLVHNDLTDAEIANELSISPSTLTNWKKREDFQEIVLKECKNKFKDLAPKAVTKMGKLLESSNQVVQLNSAKEILDRAGMIVTQKVENEQKIITVGIVDDENFQSSDDQKKSDYENYIDWVDGGFIEADFEVIEDAE